MTEIYQHITPNVSQLNRFPPVVAKQYDKGMRYITATIMDGGKPFAVDAASTVMINAKRQDGEAESFAGTVNADGTVSVPITHWMCEVDGSVACDISIVTDTGILTTMTFEVSVQQAANGNADTSDDDDVKMLVSLIQQVSEIKTVEAARVQAENARVNAENKRVTAENKRVAAEIERASHEDSRLQSEANAKASANAAAESEQTCKEYLEQVKTITTGAQGYYATEAALKAAVPVGEAGWWAVNGETDSIWVWDTDTGAWVDSHDMTELGEYYTRTQTETLVSAATSKRYTITVPASGWSATGTEGSNTYYSNTVAVSGMTADVQLCCIELSDDYKDDADAVTAYRTWSELDTGADKVTFYSASAPTADFAVTALEVR